MKIARMLLVAVTVASLVLLGREIAMAGGDCGCPVGFDCYYEEDGGYDCPGSAFCDACTCDLYFPPLVKCIAKP